MILIIDTREIKSLIFNHPEVKETKRQKLIVGDYQAILDDGFIVPVIFERKGSLADLWKSLTKEYPRFRREVIRAREANITLILIIEATLLKVLKGFERSEVSGISIVKTIFSLWVRYGVIPVFCRSREEMQEFIIQYYMAEQRKRVEKSLDK